MNESFKEAHGAEGWRLSELGVRSGMDYLLERWAAGEEMTDEQLAVIARHVERGMWARFALENGEQLSGLLAGM